MIICCVMGSMQIPQKSIDNGFMSEPGQFPEEKGADDDEETKYDH